MFKNMFHSGKKWHFTGNRQLTKAYVYEIIFFLIVNSDAALIEGLAFRRE